VADALEALSVLVGGSHERFVPNTPQRLRSARTCYDHMAGTLGVALHDRFVAAKWLSAAAAGDSSYELTPSGTRVLESLGIDISATRALRRRLAFACLDWSERRPHIGGTLGAALLSLALRKKWVTLDLDSRALSLTRTGHRDLQTRFGLDLVLGEVLGALAKKRGTARREPDTHDKVQV
jgi:hypothetical protein